MKVKNNHSVAILLGVYNGSLYLEAQVESVVLQTNKDWTLYIRDDESTDESLGIINRLCLKYENIIHLKDSKGNLGSKYNFFELLNNVDSSYYMFCDQDDYWLPNKVEDTLSKIEEVEQANPNLPIVVHTDLIVVDKRLIEISPSFWSYSKISPLLLTKFNYLAVYNLLTGCTMMINQAAKRVSLPLPTVATMHDVWIGLKVCDIGGIIDFVPAPTMLYRQHESNVLGAKRIGRLSYFISKVSSLTLMITSNFNRFKMINHIRNFSVLKYIFYKLLYTIKR